MRAWQVHEVGEPVEVLQLAEVDDPVASEGQVVLSVDAVGVGFPDLLQIQGGYQVRPAMPYTPGNEIAGTVVELGPGATGVEVGDRVLWQGRGGLAERVAAPVAGLFPMPDAMTPVQASALLVNYGTAVFALENRGKLAGGETLLVTAAAGGAGSAAVQLGKALGARVIGLAGGAEKVEIVRKLGADEAFDYRKIDLVETIRAATDSNGVDVAYEAVGGDIFDQVRRVIAWDGRLLVIGFTSGRIPDVPANHVLLKNYSIVGVHWGASLARDPNALRAHWDRIVELFGTGHIDPLVSSVHPLDSAAEAIAGIGARRTTGKVVITPNG
jgi:NADPH2:quinone reductase